MRLPPTKESEFAVMLRANPLFGDLDPSIIETLARLCSIRSVPAGTTLFQKGDVGDALYGVRRGQVSIETGTESGQRNILSILGAGDLFGEIALLDGQGRTADAVASEATELFALRRADVLTTIAREPRVGIKLIEILCRRLRAVSNHVEQCLTLKLEARLAQRLIALAEDFGEEVAITQEQLARYVGATRESVNRQLRLWQSTGLVDIRRGCIVVRNAAALRATHG